MCDIWPFTDVLHVIKIHLLKCIKQVALMHISWQWCMQNDSPKYFLHKTVSAVSFNLFDSPIVFTNIQTHTI